MIVESNLEGRKNDIFWEVVKMVEKDGDQTIYGTLHDVLVDYDLTDKEIEDIYTNLKRFLLEEE